MEVILEYTYNWIKAMSGGRKFSGHDFFAGFPQPYKKVIPNNSLNILYSALELIQKYDEDKDLSYYEFLDHKLVYPWRQGKKELTWNLYAALKRIEEDLTPRHDK